jgi:Flp pilus assembly protein TadD
VVEQVPDEPSYLDTLGWVLYKMGRYEDAVPPLCQAVLLDPGSPESRKNLGDAYWRAGNPLAANLHWEQGMMLFESPALVSEGARAFIVSEEGRRTLAELTERVANGLPQGGVVAVPGSEEGVESTFVDECQIPIS